MTNILSSYLQVRGYHSRAILRLFDVSLCSDNSHGIPLHVPVKRLCPLSGEQLRNLFNILVSPTRETLFSFSQVLAYNE